MTLRIRELREAREFRQIDVAKATGIDQKTLSNYETGKTLPDIESMCRLADFFGVTLDYLAGRTPYNLVMGEQPKKVFAIVEELVDAMDKLRNP